LAGLFWWYLFLRREWGKYDGTIAQPGCGSGRADSVIFTRR
jgi:hypothetical protein